MIQKVIYRRKAESLAPGRGLLVNYILGGGGMSGAAGGIDFYPSPPPGLSPWLPTLQAGSLFLLLPKKEFPLLNERLGQGSRKSFWGWRRWRKREEIRVPSPGRTQGSLAYRGSAGTGRSGKEDPFLSSLLLGR